MIPMTLIQNSRLFLWRWKRSLAKIQPARASTQWPKQCERNQYKCIYPYLKKVQESFDVTKELFHGGLLDVQAEILN